MPKVRFLVGLLFYFMIGAGVFISLQTRTHIRCPDEDSNRAMLYGLAWPMLLGYRILDGDMKAIPNCSLKELEKTDETK